MFQLNTDGTGYTVLKNFTGSDGAEPERGVTLSGSVVYGTTVFGGSSGAGTVFKLNTDGTGYTVLKHFAGGSGGQTPLGGLTLSGRVLYGTTQTGGSLNYGTVFKVNTNGTGFTVLKHFTDSPDGSYPIAGLTLSGSVLYGTTYRGGSSGWGTVFKVNTNGTGYTVLKHFDLNNSDGAGPQAGLTLSGSVLFGTTESGGSSGGGTVFQLNTDGTGYTVLKNFAGGTASDGCQFVDLIGGGVGTFPSGLSQTMLLQGGMTYRLSFDYNGGRYTDGSPTSGAVLDFSLGSLVSGSINVDALNAFAANGPVTPWQSISSVFTVATTDNYALTFQTMGGAFGAPYIDNVRLTAVPRLAIQRDGSGVVLSWSDPAFALQSAPAVTDTFTNIPGATSPHTNSVNTTQQFFRLIAN